MLRLSVGETQARLRRQRLGNGWPESRCWPTMGTAWLPRSRVPVASIEMSRCIKAASKLTLLVSGGGFLGISLNETTGCGRTTALVTSLSAPVLPAAGLPCWFLHPAIPLSFQCWGLADFLPSRSETSPRYRVSQAHADGGPSLDAELILMSSRHLAHDEGFRLRDRVCGAMLSTREAGHVYMLRLGEGGDVSTSKR